MHVLDKTPSYLDSLSPNLKKLEYDKWFKEKRFALAEQLGVNPSTIDNMTMFEWLRSSVKTADGKSVELLFNIQELNKLRGGLQRVEFALSKKGDPAAGTFANLFDKSEQPDYQSRNQFRFWSVFTLLFAHKPTPLNIGK